MLLISPFIYSFSFSSMKIPVIDLSTPIGASVFKFSVHLQEGKVYCVNENKDAKAHFAFFFNFSFCHFYITHMDVFVSNYLIKDYEILCILSGRQSVLCKRKSRC